MVMNSELVYSKELDFIPKLQLSKSRRAVYYTKKDLLKGKLPKKYLLEPNKSLVLKEEYKWDHSFRLCTLDNEPIVKNSKSVGKPRFWVINGQDLYNGKFERIARNVLIQKLHEYFHSLIPNCPNFNLQLKQRYCVEFTWYLLEDKVYPDTSNLWIYGKIFNDVFVKTLKVVKDDNPKYHKQDKYDTKYRETEGFKIEIWKI